MALFRCLGRFRGTKGVLLGSYVQGLGRFRGQTGVLFGSYLWCLGRLGGQKGVFLRGPGAHLFVFSRSYAFGRFWAVLEGFGRFWTVLGVLGGPKEVVLRGPACCRDQKGVFLVSYLR